MNAQERKKVEQALEALESCTPGDTSTGHVVWPSYDEQAVEQAITSLRQVIAETEKHEVSQEPVEWHPIEALYPRYGLLDIRMGNGSILCDVLPQCDGKLWWRGSGTGERFIDPEYVTHWRIHSDTNPQPKREPLTDEQILSLWKNDHDRISFARAIEAAHGIKGDT